MADKRKSIGDIFITAFSDETGTGAHLCFGFGGTEFMVPISRGMTWEIGTLARSIEQHLNDNEAEIITIANELIDEVKR